MNDTYEPAKEKKTNYRKLWRQSKQREIALHNFNQGLLLGIPKTFKNATEVAAFMKFVDYLRSQTINK